MKWNGVSCGILTLVLLSALAAQAAEPETDGSARNARTGQKAKEKPASVAARVATVNGRPILVEEILSVCYLALQNPGVKNLPDKERSQKEREILDAAREKLIDLELIIQDMEQKFSVNKTAEKAWQRVRDAASKEFDRWEHNLRDSQHFQDFAKALAVYPEKPGKPLDAFEEYLRLMGSSPQIARRQLERQFMANEFAKHMTCGGLRADYLMIQEYYNSHPEEFQVADMVKWQDLFIDATQHPSHDAARRLANALAERVRKGEDFVVLAREFDNGVASYRPNALGEGKKRGEIRPFEAEPILFQMRNGDVTVVELSTGYHVVKLVKRTSAGLTPLNAKVQKRIKDKLVQETYLREMKRYVADLRRKATIEKPDLIWKE